MARGAVTAASALAPSIAQQHLPEDLRLPLTALGEQRRRRKQDAAPRRRPVDWCGLPALLVLHRSIVSPNRTVSGQRPYRLVKIVRCQSLSATPVMSLITCLIV